MSSQQQQRPDLSHLSDDDLLGLVRGIRARRDELRLSEMTAEELDEFETLVHLICTDTCFPLALITVPERERTVAASKAIALMVKFSTPPFSEYGAH